MPQFVAKQIPSRIHHTAHSLVYLLIVHPHSLFKIHKPDHATKVVQGERNTKQNTKFLFGFSRRSLPSPRSGKGAQTERMQNKSIFIFNAEVPPTFATKWQSH